MISDKQSITELFNNHFVCIAEGVMQLDIADYFWEITKHPGIKATHNNNKGSLFKIKTINSIQIILFKSSHFICFLATHLKIKRYKRCYLKHKLLWPGSLKKLGTYIDRLP